MTTDKLQKMKEGMKSIQEDYTSKDTWTPFSKWLELREAAGDGRPNAPHGAKSCGGRDKGEKSSGVNSHVDDLSSDYKGHVKDNGTVEPYTKMKSKGGKAVAPVAK